jgi:hypothetical protein
MDAVEEQKQGMENAQKKSSSTPRPNFQKS